MQNDQKYLDRLKNVFLNACKNYNSKTRQKGKYLMLSLSDVKEIISIFKDCIKDHTSKG